MIESSKSLLFCLVLYLELNLLPQLLCTSSHLSIELVTIIQYIAYFAQIMIIKKAFLPPSAKKFQDNAIQTRKYLINS